MVFPPEPFKDSSKIAQLHKLFAISNIFPPYISPGGSVDLLVKRQVKGDEAGNARAAL